jgi:transposase
MGRNKNGYKPAKMEKVPRKPSNAEAERIERIFSFANQINFEKLGFDWGNGKRGPDSSDPKALLAVWLYGYMHGNNMGRSLSRELKRNRDLQYLSKGFLFNHSVLNKFRRKLGTILDELIDELKKYEGKPEGDLSLDGSQIECAGSHHQFRKTKDLEKNMNQHLEKENFKRANEYKAAISYSKKYPDFTSINLREHSARIIKHGGRVVKGYLILSIADDRRNVYGVRVYGANREIGVALDFVIRIHKKIDLSKHKLLADKDYFDGELLEYLEENHIDAYIPERESPMLAK